MTENVRFTSFYLPIGAVSARAVSVDVEVTKDPGPVNNLVLYTAEVTDIHLSSDEGFTYMHRNWVSPEKVEEWQLEEWKQSAINELIERNESHGGDR